MQNDKEITVLSFHLQLIHRNVMPAYRLKHGSSQPVYLVYDWHISGYER